MTRYQYDLSEKAMPFDKKMAMIQQAIDDNASLEIVYLKNNDEKTRRIIHPREAGDMMFADKPFIGVYAYCAQRKQDRVFRLDRILEMKLA